MWRADLRDKGLAGEARLQPLYQRLNMGMHGAGVGKKRIWADQRIVFLKLNNRNNQD